MKITAESEVGEIAAHHPMATRVFSRHGIDLCCRGGIPLRQACDQRGLATTQILGEIELALTSEEDDLERWTEVSVDAMSKNSFRPFSLRRLKPVAVTLVLASLVAASPALAHCDTLDGPVVMAARHALKIEDPTPVFKWVMPEHEAQIRDAFTRTLVVRRQGAEARELADRWFFETLVRIHREGEGAPFTGLQPEGSPIEPVILATDRALASGSGEELSDHLSKAVAEAVRKRFDEAREAKNHAEESVEAGRRYVAAYVELTHYVEALDALVAGHSGSHGAEPERERGHE